MCTLHENQVNTNKIPFCLLVYSVHFCSFLLYRRNGLVGMSQCRIIACEIRVTDYQQLILVILLTANKIHAVTEKPSCGLGMVNVYRFDYHKFSPNRAT